MALSSSLKSININNYIPSLFPFPSSYLKAKTSLQPLSPGSICGATNIRPSSLIENPNTSSPMLRSKKKENNYQQCFDDFCLRILKTAGSEQQKTRQNVDGNFPLN